MMVPKSGCPVFGHKLVNSGQTISIVYSRPGNWLAKVSSSSAEAESTLDISQTFARILSRFAIVPFIVSISWKRRAAHPSYNNGPVKLFDANECPIISKEGISPCRRTKKQPVVHF